MLKVVLQDTPIQDVHMLKVVLQDTPIQDEHMYIC